MRATKPTGDLASRVEVKHLASPGATPGVAEVLLSGKRVAYVFYDADFTVSFLPKDHTKLPLKAAEAREIEAVAKAKAQDLHAAASAELNDLREMGIV